MDGLDWIPIVLLGLMLFGGLTGVITDWYSWNRGICRKNLLPWERRDTDSQGGRLYAAGERSTWISWPVDWHRVDRRKKTPLQQFTEEVHK